jgi:hypothetical protein
MDAQQEYDAMRAFLTGYWERGGSKDDDVAQLLRWTDKDSGLWSEGSSADPAMWDDWLEAVRRVTEEPS